MVAPALHALLAGAIDYAGLFPPAALDMGSAVRNYDGFRRGADAWALGRFVVPASRLDDLSALLTTDRSGDSSEPLWGVSAILSGSQEADLARIGAANQRLAGIAVIDSVEARATSAADVEFLSTATEDGNTEVFIEIPLEEDIASITLAVAGIGARAKVRMGGVTEDAFPVPARVAHFLRTCHERGIAFKATAGLHHPIRASYRLTYEPDSRRAEMFGFLNLMLAALLVWKGEDEATVTALLEERDPAALFISASSIQWQEHAFSAAEIARARATFVRGFGSCSFREPLDELGVLLPAIRT